MKESKEVIPYHRPYPLDYFEKARIQEGIRKILESGMLSNLYYTRALEEKVRQYYDVKYCIATNNCTQGLLLCLAYRDLEEIQFPAFNWWSDKYIIDFLRIPRIYYNDIKKDTWLMKENDIISSLYVHTFGNIGKSLDENAIYDASHCLGAPLEDIGQATVFSLAPTKLVSSCEGGLILTNNEDMGKWLMEKRDRMSRMSEPNALIGLQTFTHLECILAWKKKVYEYYKKHIPGQFQEVEKASTYNTIGFLNVHNLRIPSHIETKQYYEPLTRGLPNTEYVYEKIICLPSYFNCPYEKIVDDILKVNKI